MRTFLEEYVDEVSASLSNNYTDNYDYQRFGELPQSNRDFSLKEILRNLRKPGGYIRANSLKESALEAFRLIAPYADRLQWLYANLADDESRRLLVRVLAFRALGHTKVKLPLSTPEYWQNVARIDQLANKEDYLRVGLLDWKLYRTSLDSLGSPMNIYGTTKGIYTQFALQQYRCILGGGAIEAERGDYVIDGGACWGDTALYFASRVGDRGRVICFEFIPSNIEILQRNLELNPALAGNVTLVERALWNNSGLPVFYSDDGPSSQVSMEELAGNSGRTTTLTIDDLVQECRLPRIDFVKMDIEGAELPALQGAAECITQFRPKLAISIYHRLCDFADIPEFIASLDLGYRFYVRHMTIHAEETVLFARAEQL